jgi:hypothetical protein
MFHQMTLALLRRHDCRIESPCDTSSGVRVLANRYVHVDQKGRSLSRKRCATSPGSTSRQLGAASGRNQTKKLKCKTQNFGIPASRDNSLLSKQLRQPCRKNTHKKQEDEGL